MSNLSEFILDLISNLIESKPYNRIRDEGYIREAREKVRSFIMVVSTSTTLNACAELAANKANIYYFTNQMEDIAYFHRLLNRVSGDIDMYHEIFLINGIDRFQMKLDDNKIININNPKNKIDIKNFLNEWLLDIIGQCFVVFSRNFRNYTTEANGTISICLEVFSRAIRSLCHLDIQKGLEYQNKLYLIFFYLKVCVKNEKLIEMVDKFIPSQYFKYDFVKLETTALLDKTEKREPEFILTNFLLYYFFHLSTLIAKLDPKKNERDILAVKSRMRECINSYGSFLEIYFNGLNMLMKNPVQEINVYSTSQLIHFDMIDNIATMFTTNDPNTKSFKKIKDKQGKVEDDLYKIVKYQNEITLLRSKIKEMTSYTGKEEDTSLEKTLSNRKKKKKKPGQKKTTIEDINLSGDLQFTSKETISKEESNVEIQPTLTPGDYSGRFFSSNSETSTNNNPIKRVGIEILNRKETTLQRNIMADIFSKLKTNPDLNVVQKEFNKLFDTYKSKIVNEESNQLNQIDHQQMKSFSLVLQYIFYALYKSYSNRPKTVTDPGDITDQAEQQSKIPEMFKGLLKYKHNEIPMFFYNDGEKVCILKLPNNQNSVLHVAATGLTEIKISDIIFLEIVETITKSFGQTNYEAYQELIGFEPNTFDHLLQWAINQNSSDAIIEECSRFCQSSFNNEDDRMKYFSVIDNIHFAPTK